MIEIRVRPKARLNSVEVLEGSKLRVHVTAPPEGGKANDAVVGLLAKELGVAKSRVRIVHGHRSSSKIIDVDGLTELEVIARMRA